MRRTLPVVFLYLNDSVMDRSVLLLPQHHQRDDDDGRYDNTADHKSDDGAFIRAHVLSEKHLPVRRRGGGV